MKTFENLLKEESNKLTNDEVLDFLDELLDDDENELSDEEEVLLNGFCYILENENISQQSLSFILSELSELYDEEYDKEEYENMISWYIAGDSELREKIEHRIRGGKKVAFRPGYRKVGGKWVRIKKSTIRKQTRQAKKRSRKPKKQSTINKAKRSRRKTYAKNKNYIKRQAAKRN